MLTHGTNPGAGDTEDDMSKVIGVITTYRGTEHACLRNHQIKVLAVFKGAASPDYDPDTDLPIATTDEELAKLGGLDANDRVEVVPWLPTEGRFSFVTSDPRAVDLACFAELCATSAGGAA